MRAVELSAEWAPREGFKLGPKDIEGKLTWLGSQVWKNPVVRVVEKPVPEIGPTEVLMKVMACGICGSDVHMAQTDEEGYILYPGLTAFPCVLGHEISGIVEKAGPQAINRRTNKPFEPGEPVTTEEMLWCGTCKPCADGFPNHCERLQELGFTVDGGYAEYVKVDAKYLWSLKPLEEIYRGDKLFLAGSLVEPTSVAYTAVIVRGGGIRPGESAVIVGGGPIGLAACAILRRAGAENIILSEPEAGRREMGRRLGATHTIDPVRENFVERVLDITGGMGAKIYLEASGIPDRVVPQIEKCIWLGRQINSTLVVVARSPVPTPITCEVYQVRRAQIVGSQGHSGHGTFWNVICLMKSGMDLTPMISAQIRLEETPQYLKRLQTDKSLCKVTVRPNL
jgi:threonine dehydrogenase-like Zn-dependent dehydrogenase